MRSWKTLSIAAPVALGLLAAPAAEAHWRGDGWRGGGYGYGWHHEHDDGGAVAGALLGLGIGALIGGAIVASQPHYAPPAPAYYAPPPPAYYAPGYAQY